MRTLVSEPLPAELEALLERRRRWGVDTHDEVWSGVLHMNPPAHGRHGALQAQMLALLGPLGRAAGLSVTAPINLGEEDDFRVPDGALQRLRPRLYYPTAALALEVLSAGDESWEKLPFYAGHGVDELLIVDPHKRAVHWLALAEGQYVPVARSALVDLGPDELANRIDWPALDG